MPKTLIAQVATAVIVDGGRRVILPGQPLPALPAKDAAELVATKAAIAGEAAADEAAADTGADDAAQITKESVSKKKGQKSA